MSTSYDIHCLTCGIEVPDYRDPTKTILRCPDTCLEDFRSGATLEAILTESRNPLAMAGLAMSHAKLPDAWEFRDRGGELWKLIEFFAAHAGHSLEVRNEYGDNWAKCLEAEARYATERAARVAAEVKP